MNDNNTQIQKIFKSIVFITSIVLVLYYIYGGLVAIQNENPFWVKIVIYFQLFIELIILSQALLIIIGIIDVISEDSSTFDTPSTLKTYPDIDIFIPIRRVKENILELTVKALREQNYLQDKVHIFIVDDTPEIEKSEKYQRLADQYNANYIYRPENIKFKAGMLNLSLPFGKSEFIAFFDFDQIPQSGILTHMISILLDNPKIAFVQTKKTFRDLDNISKIWSALLYLQFFEVYERTKNKNKAVMFAGSTACFRRAFIDDVGGIPEKTFTEDNYLTLKLLLNGYLGIFSNRVGSIGLVPNGYYNQIAQLWRWSHGGSHTLRLNFKDIITSKKIDRNQKIEFISTLGITPILVLVYLYTVSFIPIFAMGYDSPRLLVSGISLIAFVPISISITYIAFASLAIWFDRENVNSEFKFKHLPGFLVIALASNFLIFTSGLAGLLGLMGPNSDKGQWNRHIPITRLGVISLILGIILEYFSYKWLLSGLTAAIMPAIIGFTLLPTIFIVLIYKNPTTLD